MTTTKKDRSSNTNLVIYDPEGTWHATAKAAIARNKTRLWPDEQTPSQLVRLLLKHADICIAAIRASEKKK